MKSFAIDESGDIVIENGDIEMVEDEELTGQTLQTVLGTNKGEWFNDWDEGINFANVLGKGITDDMRIAEVEDAIEQVSEDLYLSEFTSSTENRVTTITFTATDRETDAEITVETDWS